jgi:predicted metal-dependent hydrolase
MKRAAFILTILVLLAIYPAIVHAAPEKTFTTRYATIYYSEDKDMDDFIWRLGGQKLEFTSDTALASSRVDRIIDRVENVLDMRPGNFKVSISLHRGKLEGERIAFYEYKTKAIHISVDNVTDGVFAHETAHALIHHNFGMLLPSKMQEILTQYVDKSLYSDYY